MGLLRFLLAASVVLEHFAPSFMPRLYPGTMAVELFFIISGFYMSLILDDKYRTDTRAGVLAFYSSRFFRLWPILFLTTVLTNLWFLAIYMLVPVPAPGLRDYIANDTAWLAMKVLNSMMIGLDVTQFMCVSPERGVVWTFNAHLHNDCGWVGHLQDIPQAWSIGTEIWFYLLAPFIVHLRWPQLLSIIAASLGLRAGMNLADQQVYFFFPAQAALFVLGIIAFRISKRGRASGAAAAAIAAIALASGAVAFGILDVDQRYKWLLFLIVAATLGGLFNLTKGWSFDREIGELSYPIYIVHFLIGSILIIVCKRLGVQFHGEAALLASVALSVAAYIFVDRPVSSWRARFASRPLSVA